MKEKFFELIEKIVQADITTITQATTAEELEAAWDKFWSEHPDLLAEIQDWAAEYADSEREVIYTAGEEISNPLEIVVLIRAGEEEDASESEIFADWEDLTRSLKNTGEKFAAAVAECINTAYIPGITAEDIFSESEALEDEEDANEDTDDVDDDADGDADDVSEG